MLPAKREIARASCSSSAALASSSARRRRSASMLRLSELLSDWSSASRQAGLVSEARSGDAAFEPVIAQAERLTASAGAPQSESWVAAQEAVTAAIAARRPTAEALSDIDGLGASALQTQGGIAPSDL